MLYARRLRRLGFTERVAELLAACDLLVTKPGPGSLAEAFHQRVPVVVACNAHTIPQERYNARLVREMGLGLTVRHWREIPVAVRALRLDPPRLAGYRSRVAALPPNRAVFEVLDLVARTLGAAGEARPVAGSSPPLHVPVSPSSDATSMAKR
jgi:UDP-N-acetylglucosamine:LPS N-acetylglucosamine transferase